VNIFIQQCISKTFGALLTFNNGTGGARPLASFHVVVPQKSSRAWTVIVDGAIAARRVHVTSGTRLVVAIVDPRTGSDAFGTSRRQRRRHCNEKCRFIHKRNHFNWQYYI